MTDSSVETMIAPLVRVLRQYLDGPGTLGAAAGRDAHELNTLYAMGHQFYKAGRYEDALKVFSFITLQDHTEKRYLIGTAACLQMLQRYDQALGFYGMASFWDPEDPMPVFHGAECLIAQGRGDEAADALASAMADCKPGRHDALRARAEGLHALLSRNALAPASAAAMAGTN